MFIFSADATARKDIDEDVKEGQKVPFIVYIHFADMFGAEQLCKVYLMRAGFTDIQIHNRKTVAPSLLQDERVLAADKAMSEAVDGGYHIQMFDDF
ncbi:hypothetical protein [Gilvimarinus xylanilyticus]|uniref:Uncharacterized protein n=1 Tax=Gilvimarinus xylanilyticus TaxID=2944139 RepID=A0A9X2KSJ2_9GAMM|nr:hypothetical protein [Gilvimarinus xylanilyticus]MCP8898304.1 hypothetical protein [Gilvimarinus xylanilyticus]